MLSNRWILIVTLVALIALLSLFAWHFEQQPTEQQNARISELALADIDSIEIDTGDIQLQLSRLEDAWNIDRPIAWPAQSSNVQRLLSILNSKTDALAQAADVDLGALGLAPPVASLRLNGVALLFGASNNIGDRRYLMVDSRIYLLPDIHLAFLTQGLPGFVDRQLLPRRYRVESIKLPEIELQRDTEDQWRTLPASAYSPAQLQQLIDNWQGLQASRIMSFDSGGAAREVIEVKLQDGNSLDFLLMASSTELIIANPQIGMQYHFLKDYADELITIRDAAIAN